MHFKFNVNINDELYYRYNYFMAFRSYYGKIRQRRKRIALGAGCVLGFALYTLLEGLSGIAAVTTLIVLILSQLFINSISRAQLNQAFKTMQRQGKLKYSANADVEFLENSFVETTEDYKTQQKYKLIDRVSMIAGEVIYIHLNNVISLIIPITAFESNHEYAQFVDFIKSKCDKVDVY
ncbi:MAG: hypothetical protein J6V09_06130 [Clostridia bacterium]|nr:hypothetical protein [Clostridia bacterium]